MMAQREIQLTPQQQERMDQAIAVVEWLQQFQIREADDQEQQADAFLYDAEGLPTLDKQTIPIEPVFTTRAKR
jgi:hypothetical protein